VLFRSPADRFATAAELADALEACGVATASEVAAWVKELAGPQLEAREALVRDLGNLTSAAVTAPVAPAPLAPARGLSPATALVVAALMAVVGVLFWRERPEPVTAVVDAGPPIAVDVVDAGTPEPIAVAVPIVDAGTVAVVAPPPPKRPPLEKKAAAKAGCTPPYVIDAQGVKRYKVECLE
jgi:serine/threonine-protein kinase